ncbi:phage tail assembly chaperone [Novosphingobium naphthalenivorans]|uniref:phage tail assembly chaperone n=1 Tax=Novosphingobium naphthalenivorans TaxID=273168 RepID=UPI0008298A80|nr:phage tail assembly chaperone [Novosphingobium naphthalenivorans]
MRSAASPLPFRGGVGGGGPRPSAVHRESPHPNPSPEGEGLRFAPAALALCALAARTLHWHPHEFWAATPAELAAALGLLAPGSAQPGLDRATLQRLMEHDHDR